MKNRNKGLTLIEVVVTVSIIAIFLGVVLSVVTTSSNSFRNTSNTAKVQMEVQEVLDNLQDMVIDANRSVFYSYGASGSSVGIGVENDIDGADVEVGSSSVRSFYVCNVKKDLGNAEVNQYDVVRWDPLTKRLEYAFAEITEQKDEGSGGGEPGNPDNPGESGLSALAEDGDPSLGGDASGAASGDGAPSEGEVGDKGYSLLAENITSFRADVSKVEGQRIVRFRISANVRGKEITTLHTVNLRNQIQVAPPNDAFIDAPKEPISVKITNAPKEIKAGETFGLRAIAYGDVQPGYHWSVEADAALGAVIDERDGFLTVKNAGKVTVTVTVYGVNGDVATDTVEIMVLEADKLKSLEISGADVVAALRGGNSFDLGSMTVTGIMESGKKITGYGPVRWELVGENQYVTLNGDNLTIFPQAWSDAGAAGSFSIRAVSVEDSAIVSNVWEIDIAKLKITNPKDGQVFNKSDSVEKKAEYYIGDSASNDYQWEIPEGLKLDGTSPMAKLGGVYVIKAFATAGQAAVKVSDEVTITVRGEYKICGADFIADTIAYGKQYILNQNPYLMTNPRQQAITYWVEDERGNYVGNVNIIDSVRVGNLHLEAIVGDITVTKDVTVVSVAIQDFTDVLETGKSYTCKAGLSTDKINEMGGYHWFCNNVGMSDNILKPTTDKITLKVTTQIAVGNKSMNGATELFTLEDSVQYTVFTTEDKGQKWKVIITEVGVNKNDEILIPASVDEVDRTLSHIKAVVRNPGGGNQNDFSSDAIGFVWSLYIPGIGMTFSNQETEDLSIFPGGAGASGAMGNLELKKWTFTGEIESLPGILSVECVIKGKNVKAQKKVNCILNKKNQEPEESSSGYDLKLSGWNTQLNVSTIGADQFEFGIELTKNDVNENGTFSWSIIWQDTGESIDGIDLSATKSQGNVNVSKTNAESIRNQITASDNKRIAIIQGKWVSEDGKHIAISNKLAITVNKTSW